MHLAERVAIRYFSAMDAGVVMRRCFNVEIVDDCLVITRFWRLTHRIPLDHVIAVTRHPSIIWYSERGRVVRSGVGFLSPVSTTKGVSADPRAGERYALEALLLSAVTSNLKKTKRAFDHLAPEEAANRLRMAQAAASWTKKHKRQQKNEYPALWAKHLHSIETTSR